MKNDPDLLPDYSAPCQDCGNLPSVPLTGLCCRHSFEGEERRRYEIEYLDTPKEKE